MTGVILHNDSKLRAQDRIIVHTLGFQGLWLLWKNSKPSLLKGTKLGL